jgi:hypothetical protein
VTLNKFYSCKHASGFLFFPIDIHRLEARVKSLPIVEEINARYLSEMAAMRAKSARADGSSSRLAAMSLSHYARSFQMTPGSLGNWRKYEALQTSLGTEPGLSGTASADVSEDLKVPRLDHDSFNLNIDVETEYDTHVYLSRNGHGQDSGKLSGGVLSCCQS